MTMNKLVLALSILLFALTSCNKEGCSDPKAINYRSTVTGEPEACFYSIATGPAYLECSDSEDSRLPNKPDSPVDYIAECGIRVDHEMVIEKNVVIHLGGPIRIFGDGKLILEEGVQLLFEEGEKIQVYGEIVANGAVGNPVVISSLENAPWDGISIEGHSSVNSFKFTNISYGEIKLQQGHTTFSNCVISNSPSYAIHDQKNSNMPGGAYSISYTVFRDNEKIMRTQTPYISGLTPSNTYINNNEQYIWVSPENSYRTVHFYKQEVPFHIKRVSGSEYDISCINNTDSVIIAPGTTIKFDTGLGIRPSSTFVCIGTTDNWIQLTGIEQVLGSWGGLSLNGLYPNKMSYTDISFVTDYDFEIGSGTNDFYLTNSIVREGINCGLVVRTNNYLGTVISTGTFFFGFFADICYL
jgi:hypothetical protein